jgi:hypothetical protein
MKAAVTSYVVCVVSNMEFSEHYFSAKRAKIYAPTVRRFVKFDAFLKVFHLERFVPYPDDYWDNLLAQLQGRLAGKNCKIAVINNFYRHLYCNAHRHEGWLSYQTKINKKIQDFFENTSVKVIDHRLLLDNHRILKKNLARYRRLQSDAVHFRDYLPIAKSLLRQLQ